jgi:hypothetical protein
MTAQPLPGAPLLPPRRLLYCLRRFRRGRGQAVIGIIRHTQSLEINSLLLAKRHGDDSRVVPIHTGEDG